MPGDVSRLVELLSSGGDAGTGVAVTTTAATDATVPSTTAVVGLTQHKATTRAEAASTVGSLKGESLAATPIRSGGGQAARAEAAVAAVQYRCSKLSARMQAAHADWREAQAQGLEMVAQSEALAGSTAALEAELTALPARVEHYRRAHKAAKEDARKGKGLSNKMVRFMSHTLGEEKRIDEVREEAAVAVEGLRAGVRRAGELTGKLQHAAETLAGVQSGSAQYLTRSRTQHASLLEDARDLHMHLTTFVAAHQALDADIVHESASRSTPVYSSPKAASKVKKRSQSHKKRASEKRARAEEKSRAERLQELRRLRYDMQQVWDVPYPLSTMIACVQCREENVDAGVREFLVRNRSATAQVILTNRASFKLYIKRDVKDGLDILIDAHVNISARLANAAGQIESAKEQLKAIYVEGEDDAEMQKLVDGLEQGAQGVLSATITARHDNSDNSRGLTNDHWALFKELAQVLAHNMP
eukprot:1195778-Prorocentrum_minimum.AAC.4